MKNFYFSELSRILETLGTSSGKGSVSMHPEIGKKSPRSRAIAEAIFTLTLVDPLVSKLKSDGLYEIFTNVEIPSLVILSHMELNGFGFCQDECERQRKVLLARLEELEEKVIHFFISFYFNIFLRNFYYRKFIFILESCQAVLHVF